MCLTWKNILTIVPKEMTKFLTKENPESFTFHSLRRTSAASAGAADNRATVSQMMEKWKPSTGVCQLKQGFCEVYNSHKAAGHYGYGKF